MNLPDPANIIFGTMMYSADQMREYAQLASRQEPAQGQDEREAFEAWWDDFAATHEDWRYADAHALRFQAWQAALALRQEQPVPDAYEPCACEPGMLCSGAVKCKPVPDEREAFEAWVRQAPDTLEPSRDFTRKEPNGAYFYAWVDSNWQAWQACAALAATAVVQGVPEGWSVIAVNPAFDDLVYCLERCERKGHLDNCPDLIEPWAQFDYQPIAAAQQKEKE